MNRYNFGIADNDFAVAGLDLAPEKAASLQAAAQNGQDIKATLDAFTYKYVDQEGLFHTQWD